MEKLLMGTVSWRDEKVLKLDSGGGCTTVNILKTTELH